MNNTNAKPAQYEHRTNGHIAIVHSMRGHTVRIEHVNERGLHRTIGTIRTMSIAMFRTFYRAI